MDIVVGLALNLGLPRAIVYAMHRWIGAITATFAEPDDPGRSGNAPVPLTGTLRLLLEFAIPFGGAWAFQAVGCTWASLLLAALVVVHALLCIDRITWLLGR